MLIQGHLNDAHSVINVISHTPQESFLHMIAKPGNLNRLRTIS